MQSASDRWLLQGHVRQARQPEILPCTSHSSDASARIRKGSEGARTEDAREVHTRASHVSPLRLDQREASVALVEGQRKLQGWLHLIAQHSSASNEHYTPREYVEAARHTLLGITLDPASCVSANETVRAVRFFAQMDDAPDDYSVSKYCGDRVVCDGLSVPWTTPGFAASRVFLNPPGGKLRRCGNLWVPVQKGPGASSMAVWWGKLMEEFPGHVESFVFVGFTLEILRLSQDKNICLEPVHGFNLCFPSERIRFSGAGSPTHANVIVAGSKHDRAMFTERFRQNFSSFGVCICPDSP